MGAIIVYIPLFFVLYVLTEQFLHRIRNLPPTPFLSLPIIGHLHLLKKPMYRTLAEISNRYGPVVFLRFGSRGVLVVSSPSAAEECLSKNDVVFADRPRLLISKWFGYNNRNLVWSSYGDHWRNLRRISTVEILSTHRLQMLAAVRLDEVKSLIGRLAKGENQVQDMNNAFFDLTFNVMLRMIVGKRFYGEDVEDADEAHRFRELQSKSTQLGGKTNMGDFIPLMSWLGLGWAAEKEIMECHQKRDAFMQNLINQHKNRAIETEPDNSFRDGRKKTLIEVLLELQESDPDQYNDETIRALMLVLLAAGTETSMNTMEWALSLMLNNPEVLQKAQLEIDQKVGHDRLMDESDMANVPFLRGIINETLRMYPPAPLMVPHESSKDCSVGGYHIPRGTMLFVNLWAIHNDPKIWADPRKFDPDRFVKVESEKLGFKLMPFGSGRRGCPGEGLGLRVIGLVLGSLIQCFEWERPGEELVDMTEGVAVSMPKARHLQAKCKPRPIVDRLHLSQTKSNLAY
ncbi:cytochrome P450 81D1-like isoform X1 [Cucurbita moschata]|uniref:Cytochrome P450 81D1-like isoform X1 n=1 Tax=Cucurbita moschata TaxID=3662 RepID=A0A6J1FJC9_CUCMO|nr:cytochrome P450 81D1-like isoform X1 [Cucurbita moschata]